MKLITHISVTKNYSFESRMGCKFDKSYSKESKIGKPSVIEVRSNLIKHEVLSNLWSEFEEIGYLGCGITGDVHEVRKKGCDMTYALKSLDKRYVSPLLIEGLKREIQLLKELDHPNIVKLYQTIEDGETIYLLMEVLRGGELFDRLKRQPNKYFSEEMSVIYMKQIVGAITYCHNRGICHRDLKLENFLFETDLLEDTAVKIVDFGLGVKFSDDVYDNNAESTNSMQATASSRNINDGKLILGRSVKPKSLPSSSAPGSGDSILKGSIVDCVGGTPNSSNASVVEGKKISMLGGPKTRVASINGVVGTPYYMAPEILKGEPYDEACDVWSLGVAAYVLLCGSPPFNGRSTEDIFVAITTGEFLFKGKAWSDVSDKARDFISKCLNINPLDRPTAAELGQHDWLRSKGVLAKSVGGAAIYRRMSIFSKESELSRLINEVSAFNLQGRELVDLKNTFIAIDKDGSGMISLDELNEAAKLLSIPISEIQATFESVDFDGTGRISYNEFLAATMHKQISGDEERLRQTFQRMDVDNSGKLDLKDLIALLQSSEGDAKSRARKLIEEADTSADGKIDWEEFLAAFRKSEAHKFAIDIGIPVSPGPLGSPERGSRAKEES